MKCLLLVALVATVRGGVLLSHAPAFLETGASVQHRNQDVFGNYNFGYNEGHTTGGTFRREAGDAFGNKVGSYGLTDADGRHRVVNYVADAAGFRANVQTNEPGTAPSLPAAASINKGVALAAPVVAAAHVAPAAYALPVGYAAPAAAAIGHYGAVTHHVAAPYHHGYLW